MTIQFPAMPNRFRAELADRLITLIDDEKAAFQCYLRTGSGSYEELRAARDQWEDALSALTVFLQIHGSYISRSLKGE